MSVPTPDLTTKLGPLKLKNPVMTASGTFGYGLEFESLLDLSLLGAVIVKGLSLEPIAGNPPPRIVETPCGMLNAIGLANIGLDSFLKEKLPKLKGLDTKIIVNIYGHHLDDYGELASALKGVDGISALEVNISCPNVERGGMVFGIDPDVSARVTERVLKNTDKPVIVKLTPNVTDIRPVAKAVESAGAHAISLINTLTGMAIDVENHTPCIRWSKPLGSRLSVWAALWITGTPWNSSLPEHGLLRWERRVSSTLGQPWMFWKASEDIAEKKASTGSMRL